MTTIIPCCWGIWGEIWNEDEGKMRLERINREGMFNVGSGSRHAEPPHTLPQWRKIWREKIDVWGCAKAPHIRVMPSWTRFQWWKNVPADKRWAFRLDNLKPSYAGQERTLRAVILGYPEDVTSDRGYGHQKWCACIKLWKLTERGVVSRAPTDRVYWSMDIARELEEKDVEKYCTSVNVTPSLTSYVGTMSAFSMHISRG